MSDATFSVRLAKEVKEELKTIAKKEDRPIGSVIRLAILEYIKAYKEKP